MANLKKSEIKGLALSTIILLVIKADDHNVTKVKGIKLKIECSHYSVMIVFYIISGLLWDHLILTIYYNHLKDERCLKDQCDWRFE